MKGKCNKTFLRNYQITIFFILTLLIGWFPWYMRCGSIFIAAPSITAILVSFLADGLAGLKAILNRMFQWRTNWRWYVFSLLSPVILYLTAVRIQFILGGDVPQFSLI